MVWTAGPSLEKSGPGSNGVPVFPGQLLPPQRDGRRGGMTFDWEVKPHTMRDNAAPENPLKRERYFRASEAALILHVSPHTVRRWADEGKIRCEITLGGHRRFPRSEVERLRQEQQKAQHDESETTTRL